MAVRPVSGDQGAESAGTEELAVRPGVRVPRGTELILPVGSIVISIGEDGLPAIEPVTPVARYQAWPDWLDVALQHAKAARSARSHITEAIEAGDDHGDHDALVREFHDTLVAVTSSAFALDALYAVIKDFVPISDDERAARKANNLPRAAWVFDAVRRVTPLTNADAKKLSEAMETIYKLRDLAVHPDYNISDFVVHHGLRQAVPAIFVHFRAENALAAFAMAAEVIMRVADLPRPGVEGLAAFAATASEVVHAIVDEHVSFSPDARLGPRTRHGTE